MSLDLSQSVEILNKFKLFKNIGSKTNLEFSSEYKKICKSNNIKDIYDCAVKNLDYHILLKDNSILQFEENSDYIRYSFIQNPYEFKSKEDFLNTIFSTEEIEEIVENNIVENLINEEEYEQFLNELQLNSFSNYFRYDYSRQGYSPLVHSYSHLHIGNNKNIRIPISKKITAEIFILFLVKHTYFYEWKQYIESNSTFKDKIKSFKSYCKNLDSKEWQIEEEFELYLF